MRRRRRVYKCIYKFFILFHKNFIFILVLEIVSFDTYSISNRDTLLIVLPAGFFRILYNRQLTTVSHQGITTVWALYRKEMCLIEF